MVSSVGQELILAVGRMTCEVATYLIAKNAKPTRIKWQFTNEDVHIKLHSLYPVF